MSLHEADFELAILAHRRRPAFHDGRTGRARRRYAIGKVLMDRVGALLLIVFLLPFVLLVVALIAIADGFPVLYAHERVGRGNTRFRCLKFRTMVLDADRRLAELLAADPAARIEWETTRKLRNDPRVSCIGRFLRKTSLDELPQLLNVLRGEMSLVGPRPITEGEMGGYGDGLDFYLAMPPGMTGLWQVSGRSSTTFEERVDLDVEYYHRRGLRCDLRLILKTVPIVLLRRGAF